MRAEFDLVFSRPPRSAQTDLEDVLALRLGDERCVLRLSDIAGVIAHPVLTVVPTPVTALLGITGNRGSVVAAYDLAVLLGRAPSEPRWLVIARSEPSLGVTFEHFDGYRRVPHSSTESLLLVQMPSVLETVRALGRNSQNNRSEN
jgi:chemotaxis signal transduction protein